MTGTAELVSDGLRLRARTWGPADGELVVLQQQAGDEVGMAGGGGQRDGGAVGVPDEQAWR